MLRGRRGRAALAGSAVLVLAAACQDGEPTARLTVVTPPPSGTAGVPTQAGPATTAPIPPPTPVPTPAPTPADPLAAYLALVADWQRSRSAFFTAVSDGTPRTVAQQRALAAAHLAGLRRLAAGVRAAESSWPAPARAAARDLLAANARQQDTVAAMARAASPGAFTARLADYGVGVAAEERAIRAVRQALAR
jgi:hypothetical protein